jgi:hypothetical protein
MIKQAFVLINTLYVQINGHKKSHQHTLMAFELYTLNSNYFTC